MKRCGRCTGITDFLDERGVCSGCRPSHFNVSVNVNSQERGPMFRVNVVFTAAGHRPQVFADLRLSDRYNVLIWEGEPAETHEAAETSANQQVEEAVRRLFFGGNAAMKDPEAKAARPLVRDNPQA